MALGAVESASIAEEVASVLRHDLRNKLAVVRNAATYIRKKLGRSEAWSSDPRLESFATMMETEIAAANALLGERMSFGHLFAREVARVSAARCVEDGVSAARVTDAQSAIEVDAGPGDVLVDPLELRLAIRCLVENAAEAPAERVSVRGKASGATYTIEVRDSGPGIADDRFEDVMRPFSSSKAGHAGLGLNVVKRIVARYGGRLTLERLPAGGVLAVVSLPSAPDAPAEGC
jgi:signal transduction histidine kinase